MNTSDLFTGAEINFIKGADAQKNLIDLDNSIYFASDTGKLYVNGTLINPTVDPIIDNITSEDLAKLLLLLLAYQQKIAELEAEINSGILKDSITHVFLNLTAWDSLVKTDNNGNPTDTSKLDSKIVYYIYDNDTSSISYTLSTDGILYLNGIKIDTNITGNDYYILPYPLCTYSNNTLTINY